MTAAKTNAERQQDWQSLIADMRDRSVTLAEIAKSCGMASRGHAHDIASGKQSRVLWEVGDALIKMHRRVMRRKSTTAA